MDFTYNNERIVLVRRNQWYSNILGRNLTKEDLTYLTVYGQIAHLEITKDSYFYNVLERDLPKENEYFYFNVHAIDLLPEEYALSNILFYKVNYSMPSYGDGFSYKVGLKTEFKVVPYSIIKEGKGSVIPSAVFYNLTEADKLHLALLGIKIQKEERSEYIEIFRECINFGVAVM